MRVTGVILTTLCVLGSAVTTATATDWDAWYDGDVSVSLRVQGGEGAVFESARDVCLSFEASEDAYHMVVGVDAGGRVQLLFPRYWEDDGWLRRGSVQQLRSADFASGGRPWKRDGIVHVEVIASPTPFEWQRLGLQRLGDGCRWQRNGRTWRLHGEPWEVLNALHQRLFPVWDHALFVVDHTWFEIGAPCLAPPVPSRSNTVVVVRPQVRVRFGWQWDFGAWCARPVYRLEPPQRPARPRASRVVVEPRRTRTYVTTPSQDPRRQRKVAVHSSSKTRNKVDTVGKPRTSQSKRVVVPRPEVQRNEVERRKLR